VIHHLVGDRDREHDEAEKERIGLKRIMVHEERNHARHRQNTEQNADSKKDEKEPGDLGERLAVAFSFFGVSNPEREGKQGDDMPRCRRGKSGDEMLVDAADEGDRSA